MQVVRSSIPDAARLRVAGEGCPPEALTETANDMFGLAKVDTAEESVTRRFIHLICPWPIPSLPVPDHIEGTSYIGDCVAGGWGLALPARCL